MSILLVFNLNKTAVNTFEYMCFPSSVPSGWNCSSKGYEHYHFNKCCQNVVHCGCTIMWRPPHSYILTSSWYHQRSIILLSWERKTVPHTTHFIDIEPEAQRAPVICLRPHSQTSSSKRTWIRISCLQTQTLCPDLGFCSIKNKYSWNMP